MPIKRITLISSLTITGITVELEVPRRVEEDREDEAREVDACVYVEPVVGGEDVPAEDETTDDVNVPIETVVGDVDNVEITATVDDARVDEEAGDDVVPKDETVCDAAVDKTVEVKRDELRKAGDVLRKAGDVLMFPDGDCLEDDATDVIEADEGVVNGAAHDGSNPQKRAM